MSEDDNLAKRVKDKVKDELNPTDKDKDTFDRGDAAAQEQKRIFREAKE